MTPSPAPPVEIAEQPDSFHSGSSALSETVQRARIERPKVTKAMIAEAAATLAKRERWDDGQAADVASEWRRHMNGYDLAKALETYHCWPINVMDVEALDCMSGEVEALHRKACISWAQENNIQPPLPIGTMTTRGEIAGIYEHDAATYRIRAHGETQEGRFLLIRFEDAKEEPGAAA